MLIVDAHLDLAWNALQWNRDLTRSVYILRTLESNTPGKGRAANTVALPELREGRVALCVATLLARSTGTPVPHLDFATPAQAYATAQGQLAFYHALADHGSIRLIMDRAALDAHVGAWQAWELADPSAPPPIGVVISFEGADPIVQPDTLDEWHDAGVRLIGPAHYGPGRYAGGTGTDGELTPLGAELLRHMERLQVALDLTHLSDPAFWQALDRFTGVVFGSHTNCRVLVPHQRQWSDAQIRAVIERGGVIGAACDAWMLQPGWVHGISTNAATTLASVVDHIDHICQIAGNSQHAAIGSDLDGGFGREQSPADLDTIADLQRLVPLLHSRGYAEADVANICYGNWLRLLRHALPAAQPDRSSAVT